jgi:hypothetical protein
VTLPPASLLIRWLYSLILISILLPAGLSGIASATLVINGLGILAVRAVVLLLVAAGLIYRLVQVARFPAALAVNISGPVVRTLRAIGVLLMCVGLTAALLTLAVKPLTLLLMRNPGDNGIGYFVVRVFLYGLIIVGWLGPPVFEFARWLGNRATNPIAEERG